MQLLRIHCCHQKESRPVERLDVIAVASERDPQRKAPGRMSVHVRFSRSAPVLSNPPLRCPHRCSKYVLGRDSIKIRDAADSVKIHDFLTHWTVRAVFIRYAAQQEGCAIPSGNCALKEISPGGLYTRFGVPLMHEHRSVLCRPLLPPLYASVI